MSYVFYIPLYIAGPICSFSAWATQVRGARAVPLAAAAWLFARVVFSTLLVEALLHLYM